MLNLIAVASVALAATAWHHMGADKREQGHYSDRTAISVPLFLFAGVALAMPGISFGITGGLVALSAVLVVAARFIVTTLRGTNTTHPLNGTR